MRAFATRWLSGDERTVGALLAVGLLVQALFRLDRLRSVLGVAPDPEIPLATTLVAVALAWWSMLPRGFVWLEPSVLTWRDFGDVDREGLVARRLMSGWLWRMLTLGYLLALLGAVNGVPTGQIVAGSRSWLPPARSRSARSAGCAGHRGWRRSRCCCSPRSRWLPGPARFC